MQKTLFYLLIGVLLLLASGCEEKTTEPLSTLPAPVFNLSGGTYPGPQTITISCQESGAEIRFTLDGSEPIGSSELYTAQISISETTVLKAKAYKEGWHPSDTSVLSLVIEEIVVDRVEIADFLEEFSIEQVVNIYARALDADGNPLPDGVVITFSSTSGFFCNTNTAQMEDGWAVVEWNTGTTAGLVTIIARAGEVSDELVTTILSGPPTALSLQLQYLDEDSDWLPLSGSIPLNFSYNIRLRMLVRDIYLNPVPYRQLNVSTNIGSIESSAITNANGVAYLDYQPSNVTGTVEISVSVIGTAITETVYLVITSSEVLKLYFVQDEQIYLDALGYGDNNSTDLQIWLLGLNGLVTNDQWVRFEIIAAGSIPTGININGAGLSDDVLSVGGVATITVNSGSGVGNAYVKASLVDDLDLSSISPLIRVSSGPQSITPIISDMNTAEDMGNGIWRLEAGAVVKELDNEPVIDGTEVVFSLGTEPPIPENCYIDPLGYTGYSTPSNEDGTPGYAGTFLYYHGEDTFRHITLIAQAGDATGSQLVALPLQFPAMSLEVAGDNLDFFSDDPPDAFRDITLYTSVTDGQGSNITGADILISTSHGVMVYYDWFDDQGNPVNDPDNPNLISTYEGLAQGTLRFRIWELPPPDDEYFTTVDVEIIAHLIGTDLTIQTSFTIRRYNVPNPGD